MGELLEYADCDLINKKETLITEKEYRESDTSFMHYFQMAANKKPWYAYKEYI